MEEDILLDLEEVSVKGITHKNLLLKIWTRPKDTFRFLFANAQDKYVIPLMILSGVCRGLGKWSEDNGFSIVGSWTGLISVILFGGVFGWLFYWVYSWGISATGKWLGGTGDTAQCATVVAWASIPGILGVILIIPEQYLFLQEYSSSLYEPSLLNDTLSPYELFFYSINVVRVIIGFWSIYIAIEGIGLVQEFGRGTAFLNYILPLIVFLVPLVAILFIIQS